MFKDLIKDIINEVNSIKDLASKQENLIRKCPLCNVEFNILNIKFPDGSILKIEQCSQCSSLWFDKGELTKALEISLKDIEKFFPSTSGKSIKGSGKRLCPVCSNPMKLINYSMDSNIWVDVCSCGIFLDAGELELLKLYSLNPKTFKAEYVEDATFYSTVYSKLDNNQLVDQKLKNINEILEDVNLLKKDIQELKDSILSKVKNIETELKNKNIKYLLSIYKDPLKEEKLKLNQIKNRIDLIKEKINRFNLGIKDIKDFEEIIILVDSLNKFIKTREYSINLRIEEVQKEQEKPKEEQKTEQLIKDLTKVEQKIENKIINQRKMIEEQQIKQEVKQQIKQEIKEEKKEFNKDPIYTESVKNISQKQINIKINKIKFNFYSNLLNYFKYDSKVILLGENKLFLFDLGALNQENFDFKEIKINYLVNRFRGLSFIDNKLFIYGNSGSIFMVYDLNDLINSLSLSEKNTLSFKVGYSDINNVVKFGNDEYLVVVNSKLYLVDKDFKILKEKSFNVINGINYKGNLIFSNSSGEIVFLNSNLEVDKKISTGSFYSIKNFKVFNDKVFALSTGFIGYIEDEIFKKISLPKSFIEVNDIDYINDIYFIVGSSGSLFYTNNLSDITDFNTGIYENINSILKVNDNLILSLCNSATLLKIEIM
jgi:Zn-finger nucleic acid-binding protein